MRSGLFVTFGIVAFVVLIALIIGYDQVPAGNVGVLDTFGEVDSIPKQPGLWWTGVFTDTVPMSIQIQKAEYDASAASKDLQVVSTQVALNFRLNPSSAPELYKNIGIGYQDVIIQPIVQEAVKSQTAKYNAEELITQRESVKAQITDYITLKLQDKGLMVTEVAITNFEFGREFNKAIEMKQVAEQKAIEARHKLAEMEFTSQAMELQKEVIEIKKLDIQQQWIAKWDGQLPNVMTSGGMLLEMPIEGAQ